jgi:hypothetical protein
MSEKHDDPCQEAIATMRQRSLNELQRGAAGGRALAEQRGAAYLRQLAAAGGRSTLARYGVAHLRQLAAAGGREKRRRAYTWPRTIRPWYGGVERRVPYWPARSSKRRRRPVFVRIEVQP